MANNEDYQAHEPGATSEAQQNVFKEEPKIEKKPTMSGLDENIAGLLCYIAIIGLVFLFIEKENKFIRFHALQAIFSCVAVFILSIILSIIPFIGWIISLLLFPIFIILFLFLMYQAYNGKMFKLPFIGELADKYAVTD